MSKEDIIPMKLVTIVQDGRRIKDFIDIAFLSSEFSLNEMLGLYINKYGYDNSLSIVKGITYFDNIKIDENVKVF